MTDKRIYDKLKSKIGEANSFLGQMGVDIVENKTIDETIHSAMHSYLHNWYSENSDTIYVDDVIQIKATDDAYSTAIIIEGDDGLYTAFINDGPNNIKKFENVEDLSYDAVANELVLTTDGTEVYNFRPPTQPVMDGNEIVSYIIHPDGRITYYMADGSCIVSHEFEYDDGIIEYIECEICDDMVLIQVIFITYTWKEDYELIYYDNYIETVELQYHFFDTYVYEENNIFLEDVMQLSWYTFNERAELIYYDNASSDIIHNFSYQDFRRPEFEKPKVIDYHIDKEYEPTPPRILTLGYPIYWDYPVIPPIEIWVDENDRYYGPSTGGGGGEGGNYNGSPTGSVSANNPTGGGNRAPSYGTGDGVADADNPILPSKDPLEKVLGCDRTVDGLRITFGDRSWIIPYRFMNQYSTTCNTQNYNVRVGQEHGRLVLDLNSCGHSFILGKATEFDGDDGIDTVGFKLVGGTIYQETILNGERTIREIMGEVKFPHITEAFISDKRALVLRNDLGDYLVTDAIYPNNNGNMGIFPVFKHEFDDAGKSSINGYFYYDDENYNDKVITLDDSAINPDVGERSFFFENGFLFYDTSLGRSNYRIPESGQYMGVTDIKINRDDKLLIENGFYSVTVSDNSLVTKVSSISLTDHQFTLVNTLSGSNQSNVISTQHNPAEVTGEDGVYISTAERVDGILTIELSDGKLELEQQVDVILPNAITSEKIEGLELFDLSMTRFYMGNDIITLTQSQKPTDDPRILNWLKSGYTSAFHGDRGNVIVDAEIDDTEIQHTIQFLGSNDKTFTLEDYGTTTYITQITEDRTNNTLIVEYASGEKDYTDFKLGGEDTAYIGSVIEQKDSIYVEWSNRNEPLFLGIIHNYNGNLPLYPTAIVENDKIFTFEMPGGNIDVDIYELVKDRGILLRGISYEDNKVSITGDLGHDFGTLDLLLDAGQITLIEDISLTDTDTLTFTSNKAASWNTNTKILGIHGDYPTESTISYGEDADSITFNMDRGDNKVIQLSGKLHGVDGTYPRSLVYADNVTTVETSNGTFVVPSVLDGLDGHYPTSISYNNGELSYTLSDGTSQTLISGGDILDGQDGIYITEFIYGESSLDYKRSDNTVVRLLDDIDGIDTTKSILDITMNEDDNILVTHVDGTLTESETPILVGLVSDTNTGEVLTLEFDHETFILDEMNGIDYPDGRWLTSVEFRNGDMIGIWDDQTEVMIGVTNSTIIEDVRINNDGYLEITSNKDMFVSPRSVLAAQPEREITGVSMVDYELFITFDNDVWNLGNVRGANSSENIKSLVIENGRLYGNINDTHTIGGDLIDGNFGFETFDPSKEYRAIDSVYKDEKLYVLLDDSATLDPGIPDSGWASVYMVDDAQSFVGRPKHIHPVDSGSVSTGTIRLEASDLRATYTGIVLGNRQFQVRSVNGTWVDAVVDMVTTNTSVYTDIALGDGEYVWRCRDKAEGWVTYGPWSTPTTFTVLSVGATPTLNTNDNTKVNSTLTIGYNESFDYFEINFVGTESRTVTVNAKTYNIPIGLLVPNETYMVATRASKDGNFSPWSNPITISENAVLDMGATSPVIAFNDVENGINPKINIDNTDTTHFLSVMLHNKVKSLWEVMDVDNKVIWSFSNGVDFKQTILRSPKIVIDESTKIRMRYVMGSKSGPWSNVLEYIPVEDLTTPSVTVNRITGMLDYRFNANYSSLTDLIFSDWEFSDSSFNLVKTFTRTESPSTLDMRVPVDWAGQSMNVRVRIYNQSRMASEWSEWTSFTVTHNSSGISPPTIKDYFVHEFGAVFVSGNVSFPTEVEYEVNGITTTYQRTFDAVFDDDKGRISKTVKVPHDTFVRGEIYEMKARQYHSSTGWSGWSPSETFGYDFSTSPDDTQLIIPTGIDSGSVVAIGAGSGGCESSLDGHAGTGGSLSYVNDISLHGGSVSIVVGRGGEDHSKGGNSHVSDIIVAQGGVSKMSSLSVDRESYGSNCNMNSGFYLGGLGTPEGASDQGAGGAAGYISNGADGNTISPIGESGSGGILTTDGGRGGDTSILGSTPRVMVVGDSGGEFYPTIPKAGGGGGFGLSYHKGTDGGVGILYGILKFPLGVTAPWNEDYQ